MRLTRRDLLPMLLAPGLVYTWWRWGPPLPEGSCTTMMLASSDRLICTSTPFPHQCTPDCDGTLHRDTIHTGVSGVTVLEHFWQPDSPILILDLQPLAPALGVQGFAVVFLAAKDDAARRP